MYTLYIMYTSVVQQWDINSLRGITCTKLNRKPGTYLDFVLQKYFFTYSLPQTATFVCRAHLLKYHLLNVIPCMYVRTYLRTVCICVYYTL